MVKITSKKPIVKSKETAKKASAPTLANTQSGTYGVKELVELYVANYGGTKKEADASIRNTIECIKGAIANGEGVQFLGDFTIQKSHREAHKGRNPQTGAEITIPASTGLKIKVGTKFKAVLNS